MGHQAYTPRTKVPKLTVIVSVGRLDCLSNLVCNPCVLLLESINFVVLGASSDCTCGPAARPAGVNQFQAR